MINVIGPQQTLVVASFLIAIFSSRALKMISIEGDITSRSRNSAW